jgi:SAM-dependent methyltransferase
MFKSVSKIYDKLSNFGKILIFMTLLLILTVFFNSANKLKKQEGFQQSDKFLFKTGNDVYDDFYASIYDYLVYNNIKNEYEIGAIINGTQPTEASIIVDIGSGTGHHVSSMAQKGYNVVGIDISPSMVNEAKIKYPDCNFQVGDALDTTQFSYSSVTHIFCLYFTIYYFKDKRKFFDNCMDWLMPGGYLIVHLVDRETFDPILPPANPLVILSPQRYAKERITKSKVKFDDFSYTANFDLDNKSDLAKFKEKFEFNNGKIKKQEHKMYMPSENEIITLAQNTGFILHGVIDLISAGYEYNHLYIFIKPN